MESRVGTTVRTYARAPIAEAVIDLRAAVSPDVTVEDLARVAAKEQDRYPLHQETFHVESQLDLTSATVRATGARHQTGHIYVSPDRKQVFQARLDGFTFSRLSPYANWQEFEGEALRLWDLYKDIARPSVLTRVSVRFINRIELPVEDNLVHLEEFVRTYPESSSSLPALGAFLMQLQIPMPKYGALLNLIETIVPDAVSRRLSLILDNEVIREVDEKVTAPGFDETLRGLLAGLHKAKNEAFEACITDKTREMISE